MTGRYEKERAAALEAVSRAARLCARVQASIGSGVAKKEDRSPVTVADFASQAVVCRALAEAFPDDPVMAEEDSGFLAKPENAALRDQVVALVREVHPAGWEEIRLWIDSNRTRETRPRFWTLDPIDGTKGFLRGDQYAIALALLVDGRPVVGVLGCPNLKPAGLFAAVRGRGAASLPIQGGRETPVRVSRRGDPADAVMCESFEAGHTVHDRTGEVARRLGLRKPPIRMDSQAKYALVAGGGADLYLRIPPGAAYRENLWDHAAGALVAEEAGGRVTDLDGRPLDFSLGSTLSANRGIVLTNGLLHEAVLKQV
jgi:3'(2'), 5'-bisphosphate nucleotidase